MIDQIIQKYLDKLEKLRTDESEFEKYKFELLADKTNDKNCFNRFSIGVGFFNDLQVPDDYKLIKKLFKEEIKYLNAHKKFNFENFAHEIIYMYSYFLSEFGKIEDIWSFAALKFDGSMDSDSGFETDFFLTYGKENLRKYLASSTHQLTNKIQERIFTSESCYSDESGQEYKENQISFFDFKKPINHPIRFYQSLNEKEYFMIEFEKWKEENDLSNSRIAYDYVNFAEYTEIEEEIKKALLNYIKIKPDNWLSDQYRRRLGMKKDKK